MRPSERRSIPLLKLNNDYAKWTAGAPDDKTAKLYAFVHAATWADDIKTKQYGYKRDKVDSPTAGQNIGYLHLALVSCTVPVMETVLPSSGGMPEKALITLEGMKPVNAWFGYPRMHCLSSHFLACSLASARVFPILPERGDPRSSP